VASALRTGSPRERRSASEQQFRGVIEVIDAAVGIDREHALAHGIERDHRARPRGDGRGDRRRQHFQGGQQQRRFTGAVDDGARQFDPGDLVLRAEQFDFIALGSRFARQAPAQILVDQFDVFRRDEIRQRPADHRVRGGAEQRQEPRVGEQDPLAMHQHRVVHRLHQSLEQHLAILQP
jgi:hypothetical protein